MVGLGGLEPPTSVLSGLRSNLLSYRPNRHRALGYSTQHRAIRQNRAFVTSNTTAIVRPSMERRRLRGHRRRARSSSRTPLHADLSATDALALSPGLRGFSRAARASYPARVPAPRGRPGLVHSVLVSLFISVPRRSSPPGGRRCERALRGACACATRSPGSALPPSPSSAQSPLPTRPMIVSCSSAGRRQAQSGGRRMPASVLIFRRIHNGGPRTTWRMLPHGPMGHSPLSVTQRARTSRNMRRRL